MVTICHHIHSMHTCKSEMWYVCMCGDVICVYVWLCLSISLLGYLLMDISFFPSIYLLSFFICIPLVDFCILLFGWFLYSLNTTFHHTSIVYISLGFERSSSWAINLRPFDSGDSYLWICRKAWGLCCLTTRSDHMSREVVFFVCFFSVSVYDVQHISYFIWYIYIWIDIYIYILHLDMNMLWHFLSTVFENGTKDGFFKRCANGHW